MICEGESRKEQKIKS